MHAKWLIRSYSLTLANTTLHMALPSVTTLLDDRTTAYRAAVRIALINTLGIAECFVRRVAHSVPHRLSASRLPKSDSSD